jgi:hypothetical protein
MLDFCTHRGDASVDLFIDGVELPAPGCLAHDTPNEGLEQNILRYVTIYNQQL